MVGVLVCVSNFGQQPLWRDTAVDAALPLFVPAQIERGQIGKETHVGIGQMVVNPPRQPAPIGARVIAVYEPRDDDGGHGAHVTIGIQPVPDMVGVGSLVGGAVVLVPVSGPDFVDRHGPTGRANADAPEGGVERFEEFLAQFGPGFDGKVWVVWDIWNAFDLRDFGIEKIAHEEIRRQADAAKIFQRFDGFGRAQL